MLAETLCWLIRALKSSSNSKTWMNLEYRLSKTWVELALLVYTLNKMSTLLFWIHMFQYFLFIWNTNLHEVHSLSWYHSGAGLPALWRMPFSGCCHKLVEVRRSVDTPVWISSLTSPPVSLQVILVYSPVSWNCLSGPFHDTFYKMCILLLFVFWTVTTIFDSLF